MNDAFEGQKRPPPGMRPAPLPEVAGPQAAVMIGYVAAGVPLLGAPSMAGPSAEVIDGSTLSFLPQRALDVKRKEKEEEAACGAPAGHSSDLVHALPRRSACRSLVPGQRGDWEEEEKEEEEEEAEDVEDSPVSALLLFLGWFLRLLYSDPAFDSRPALLFYVCRQEYRKIGFLGAALVSTTALACLSWFCWCRRTSRYVPFFCVRIQRNAWSSVVHACYASVLGWLLEEFHDFLREGVNSAPEVDSRASSLAVKIPGAVLGYVIDMPVIVDIPVVAHRPFPLVQCSRPL